MSTIGLRELRQNASDIVRQVEAGEQVTITVSGRPAAVMIPPDRSPWRRFDEIKAIFAGPADVDRERDRDLLDTGVRDPWSTA